METFSRGQQFIVLLIIFGMTLLYFHSINQPESQNVGYAAPTNNQWAQPTLHSDSPIHRLTHSPSSNKKLSGPQLLTLNRKINLNTASMKDLEAISGIGPKTAEKIVQYRKEHGKFENVEDIMNVKGIGEKKFEKMKEYLTVK